MKHLGRGAAFLSAAMMGGLVGYATAEDVVMGKGRLTLIGVSQTTLFFSDRPKRIVGHMATADFVLEWQEGTGKESFHADPPNAAK